MKRSRYALTPEQTANNYAVLSFAVRHRDKVRLKLSVEGVLSVVTKIDDVSEIIEALQDDGLSVEIILSHETSRTPLSKIRIPDKRRAGGII